MHTYIYIYIYTHTHLVSIYKYIRKHTQETEKKQVGWSMFQPATCLVCPPPTKDVWLQRRPTKQPSSRSISRIPNDNQSFRLRDESTNVENTLKLQTLISFIKSFFLSNWWGFCCWRLFFLAKGQINSNHKWVFSSQHKGWEVSRHRALRKIFRKK